MTIVLRKVPQFGAGIVWGTFSSGLPVFWITSPGCSRNGYGTSPSLWVQKKLVKFWQGTQDTGLRSAKLFWEFLSYSPFSLQRLQFYIIPQYFQFSYLYLSLAGNWIVYNPNQGTNREKYFNHFIFKEKDANSGGKWTILRPFLPSQTASSPSFDGKSTGPIRQKWPSKWLFPRRHNK